MSKIDLSDVYRDYIACINKQNWPKLEQFVGSSLKGVGKSEFGGGLA